MNRREGFARDEAARGLPGWVGLVLGGAALWATISGARGASDARAVERAHRRPLDVGVTAYMQPASADPDLPVLLPDGSHARWGELRARLLADRVH